MKLAEDLRRSVLQAAIEGKLTGGRCEGWRFVRLMDISLSIQYGYNAPAREKGSVKMVRISDIQNNNIQWHNVPYCEISEYEMQKYLLAKNDILFARTGGTVGKSYLVGNIPEKAIYAGYLIRLRISDEVNPQYVKYFMESESYWKQLRSGTTATAQPNCNGKTLSQMIIPLPPIDEQRRIVSRLDAIMPLIAELESAENELEALERKFPGYMRDSLLQAAIDGRLTGSNTDNWLWVQLGDIGRWQSGATPSKTRPEFYGDNIPWLVTGDLNDDFIGDKDITHRITETALAETSVKMNPRGSVLIAMYGATIGRTGVLNVDATTNQACCACLPYEGVYNEYLFRVLQALKQTFINMAAGGAQPNISKEKIIRTIVPLPPLDEQHKIVERLNELLPLCEAMKGE